LKIMSGIVGYYIVRIIDLETRKKMPLKEFIKLKKFLKNFQIVS
jgi:hypothetical protein